MGAQPYRERVLEAERIAEQAVQADPEDGTALAIASWVYTILVGKHAPSREYAERALRLQPNSAFVCVNSGFGYLYRGELDTARYNFERALRINPLDPRNYLIMQGLGIILFFERNFAEALPLFNRSIELAPSARVTWRYKAATLAHLGRTEEAREAVAALAVRDSPGVLPHSLHATCLSPDGRPTLGRARPVAGAQRGGGSSGGCSLLRRRGRRRR